MAERLLQENNVNNNNNNLFNWMYILLDMRDVNMRFWFVQRFAYIMFIRLRLLLINDILTFQVTFYAKSAHFTRLYLPHFKTLRNKTSLFSVKILRYLLLCLFFSPCLDQIFVCCSNLSI